MTSSIRRIASEKRWLALGLSGLLAANVAVFVFVVRPLAASSHGAAARAAVAAEAVNAAEREHASIQARIAARQRAREELTAFYRTVLPENLSAARRLTYASLPAMAKQASLQYQRRRFDLEVPGQDRRLTRLAIRMELQGQYENLRQFIYQVEGAPEFVIIDDVTLTERNAVQPLTLAITLSTYFRSAGNEF